MIMKRKTVLVIEDNEMNMKLVRALLQTVRHISEGKGDVHAERAQIFSYVRYVGIRQR
jgi:CheY-like chemotaxis protein